jgi:hypothetical protein
MNKQIILLIIHYKYYINFINTMMMIKRLKKEFFDKLNYLKNEINIIE